MTRLPRVLQIGPLEGFNADRRIVLRAARRICAYTRNSAAQCSDSIREATSDQLLFQGTE